MKVVVSSKSTINMTTYTGVTSISIVGDNYVIATTDGTKSYNKNSYIVVILG